MQMIVNLGVLVNSKDLRLDVEATHKQKSAQVLCDLLISMVEECIIIAGNDYTTSSSVSNIVEMLFVHLELVPLHFELPT